MGGLTLWVAPTPLSDCKVTLRGPNRPRRRIIYCSGRAPTRLPGQVRPQADVQRQPIVAGCEAALLIGYHAFQGGIRGKKVRVTSANTHKATKVMALECIHAGRAQWVIHLLPAPVGIYQRPNLSFRKYPVPAWRRNIKPPPGRKPRHQLVVVLVLELVAKRVILQRRAMPAAQLSAKNRPAVGAKATSTEEVVALDWKKRLPAEKPSTRVPLVVVLCATAGVSGSNKAVTNRQISWRIEKKRT